MGEGDKAVAEQVQGRVNFLGTLFTKEGLEKFLTGSQIDYGHAPSAEHRINLLLLGLYVAGNFTKGEAGREDTVNSWLNGEHVLLGDRNPVDYLRESEDVSDSLFMSVNGLALITGANRVVTDNQTAAFLGKMQGLFDKTEEQFKDGAPAD